MEVKHIELLRDSAIALEQKFPQLAIDLMSLAFKHRPYDPSIKSKMDHYLKVHSVSESIDESLIKALNPLQETEYYFELAFFLLGIYSKLTNELKCLVHIEVLRDCALVLEEKQPQLAIDLMSFVLKHNPNDIIANEKFSEYSLHHSVSEEPDLSILAALSKLHKTGFKKLLLQFVLNKDFEFSFDQEQVRKKQSIAYVNAKVKADNLIANFNFTNNDIKNATLLVPMKNKGRFNEYYHFLFSVFSDIIVKFNDNIICKGQTYILAFPCQSFYLSNYLLDLANKLGIKLIVTFRQDLGFVELLFKKKITMSYYDDVHEPSGGAPRIKKIRDAITPTLGVDLSKSESRIRRSARYVVAFPLRVILKILRHTAPQNIKNTLSRPLNRYLKKSKSIARKKVLILVREGKDSGLEQYTSAKERRSIPNIMDLEPLLDRDLFDVTVIDMVTVGIFEKIALINSHDIIVSQTGAEIANLVYAREGSVYIEIRPDIRFVSTYLALVKGNIRTMGEILTHAGNIRHIDFHQENNHANIDLKLLAKVIKGCYE